MISCRGWEDSHPLGSFGGAVQLSGRKRWYLQVYCWAQMGITAFVHRLKGVIEESCRGYLRPREKETQLQRYMVAFAVQSVWQYWPVAAKR